MKKVKKEEVKGVTIVSDVDGHSQCLMSVDAEEGKVIDIRGDPLDPEGRGELTLRGKHMKSVLYAPDRLQYPMKRVGEKGGGEWEKISWDEALTTIANRLNEIKEKYGAEAIDFHYGHYHSGDVSSYLSRLANLIGTPNISTPNLVCHVPRIFMQFIFDFGAVVPPDVAHTSLILIWGGNPKVTNKPQSIAIKEARERGAKLVVIDPKVTSYAEEADIHAQLRPGTDGALALGMLNVIINEELYDVEFVEEWTIGFEELKKFVQDYPPEEVEEITWVSADIIREIARMYATTKPACISPRNALDQHTNASCTIRAINILMTITGNLDVAGGNIIALPVLMGQNDVSLSEKLPPEALGKKIGVDRCLISKILHMFPTAATPALWDAIIHDKPYPVKAMFVMAANPAVTCANSNVVEEALRKLDFLVVADIFMTPTAELADIVLPACTFLEKTRYATYSTHADHSWNARSRIVLSPKVVEPLYESWSDWQIICEVGKKLGYAEYFPWETREEAIDYELEPLGITCEKLRAHPEGIPITLPPLMYKKVSGFFGGILRSILKMTKFKHYPEMYRKYEGFMGGFFTPSKKVALYSERLEELGYDPLPVYKEPAESPVSRPDLATEYPLILMTGSKLETYTHSMMRNIPELYEQFPKNLLEINPKAAMELGIEEGNVVGVESPRGRIECSAYVTDRIDPRVVSLYHGFAESNCNALTDNNAVDPITGSTGLKSLLCKVEKI
uniref:Formate dehydrogenase subunit alpha n=1 Tax=Candidatus Methanophaga sp. ANME-1 ERB7 TaxID=2759913 RepID=A0A7G9Z704_9EURY|nr:formate dehydrogenase subunit alpha [Methanosarcinales archaeon ANME-1 ERB7]